MLLVLDVFATVGTGIPESENSALLQYGGHLDERFLARKLFTAVSAAKTGQSISAMAKCGSIRTDAGLT